MSGRRCDWLGKIESDHRGQVADLDAGVAAFHFPNSPTAPSSAAVAIFSTDIGFFTLPANIPLSEETGSLGKSTTVPSGWRKIFTRSPGLTPRCSRAAFGMVICPLLVSADSIYCRTRPPMPTGNTKYHRSRLSKSTCVIETPSTAYYSLFPEPCLTVSPPTPVHSHAAQSAYRAARRPWAVWLPQFATTQCARGTADACCPTGSIAAASQAFWVRSKET